MNDDITIPLIAVDDQLRSVFSEKTLQMSARGGMNITEQLPAHSCRLRHSAAGYCSDWHVAGDPTLIVIQQGVLRIYLRDNSYKDFKAGDCFIAQDYLPEGIAFSEQHGHRAEVLGEQDLYAAHLKLANSV